MFWFGRGWIFKRWECLIEIPAHFVKNLLIFEKHFALEKKLDFIGETLAEVTS